MHACRIALVAALALLVGARPSAAAPPRQQPAASADRLLFTRGLDQGPLRGALDLLRARLRKLDGAPSSGGGELREEVRPLAPLLVGSGKEAREGDLGLAIERALREARVACGYALDFRDETGMLRLYAFDATRGVDALVGIKIENERRRSDGPKKGTEENEEDEEEKELEVSVGGAIDRLLSMLDAERKAAETQDASDGEEKVRWLDDEDPIDLGFRWEYGAADGGTFAQVKRVLDTSSLGRADLRRGDVILAIGGASVASPPLFGRAVGRLKAGAPLAVTVRRDGATLELAGRVERASEVVPAYEQKQVGAKLTAFRAAIGGAPVEVAGSKPAPVTIVCLFDPRRPDTLRDAAVLAWLRDRHAPDEVAIAGIAIHASDAEVKAAMEELAAGWPAAADPDGRLAEATRTLQLPGLLVAGRDGVVRRRQARDGELQREVRSLLAAGR